MKNFEKGGLTAKIGFCLVVATFVVGVSIFLLRREEDEGMLFLENLLVQKKLCLTRLATVERMKISWVVNLKRKKIGDAISYEEFKAQYGRDFSFGECPAGGVLTVNPIGKHAECSYRGHRLPVDWKESDFLP